MNVCVVLERSKKEQREHLYGVFVNEEAARSAYGKPSDAYEVTYFICRVFGDEA